MIGSFGPVIFETSDRRLRTFDNFRRTGGSRWADHEICNGKPLKEFLGPGLEQINFNMRLDAALGINPAQELAVLRLFRDSGITMPFILNGQPVSQNNWVIDNMEEAWSRIDNQGRLLMATVDLTLSEYVLPLEVMS